MRSLLIFALGILSGCGGVMPLGQNATVDSVFADISISPAPQPVPPESCVIESVGRVVLPPGSSLLQCGPSVQPTPLAHPAPTGQAADGAAPTHTDRLTDSLYDDEGFERIPYMLDEVCHIGMGRVVDRASCEAVNDAASQAERVLGAAWPRLSSVRQDAATVWCYWSACAGFRSAIAAIQVGDFRRAAAEIMDSTLPQINYPRAAELAATIETGEWKFRAPTFIGE